jgi:hypothetical protein
VDSGQHACVAWQAFPSLKPVIAPVVIAPVVIASAAKQTLNARQRQGLLAPGLHHVATQPLPLPRLKAYGATQQVDKLQGSLSQ